VLFFLGGDLEMPGSLMPTQSLLEVWFLQSGCALHLSVSAGSARPCAAHYLPGIGHVGDYARDNARELEATKKLAKESSHETAHEISMSGNVLRISALKLE
jgi:hypothetical protein